MYSLAWCSSPDVHRTRMQIEESFRDLKTVLDFNASQTRTLKYLAVLLLIAMLAQYIFFTWNGDKIEWSTPWLSS